jgi:hypothetical protein
MGIAERDPSVPEVIAAPDPPNLKGTALARIDSRVELDVKELDRFHNNPAKHDA